MSPVSFALVLALTPPPPAPPAADLSQDRFGPVLSCHATFIVRRQGGMRTVEGAAEAEAYFGRRAAEIGAALGRTPEQVEQETQLRVEAMPRLGAAIVNAATDVCLGRARSGF